jgi:protoporphyrinogen/coproporphyrinogen III oxidase
MRRDVVVVGGGITGLSAAYALSKAGADFQLLEASERWGGVIRSETVDGFQFEAGPDAMLAQKPEGLQLARELGLGERLVPTNPQERAVYVLLRGRLHPLPDGMLLAVPTRIWPFVRSGLFSWPGKLRMGLDVFMRPRPAAQDESIASFLGRHFGRECVERLGEPLLAGIHAGDPERLSMRCTFPRFVAVEAQHGSLARGLRALRPKPTPGAAPPSAFYSLRGGLGEMVAALVSRVPAERLCLRNPVQAVERAPHGYRVRLSDGSVDARAVIVTAPAPRAAAVVGEVLPRTSAWLASIPFASTATVLLGYKREDVAHPLNGYGLVIPKTEGLRTSALSFLSTKFPGRVPEGRVLLRGFVGGARDPQALTLDDAALIALVTREMRSVVGLRGEPVLARVYRWPQGTPQMEVGHLERLADLQGEQQAAPGLFLAGAGIRSTGIPDMIADGRQAAEAALALLRS